MKNTKSVKSFRQFNENLNNELSKDTSSSISDVSDSKFELIGPNMDEILDAINFINENYKEVKLKPMDWSLLVSDNYSIFVKFEPEGDENKHIRYMNDLLSENDFKCKLYKTKRGV